MNYFIKFTFNLFMMKNKVIISETITIVYLLTGIISPLVFVKVFFIDKSNFTWYWLLLVIYFLSFIVYNVNYKKESASTLSLHNRKTATITIVLTIIAVIVSIIWALLKK